MANHENPNDELSPSQVSCDSHEDAAASQSSSQENEEIQQPDFRTAQRRRLLGGGERDFRQTPKYEDMESYVTQRAHSIGEGVYLTDDYQDLPPRFKKKFLNLLESVGFQIDPATSKIICFSPKTDSNFRTRKPVQPEKISTDDCSSSAIQNQLLSNQPSTSNANAEFENPKLKVRDDSHPKGKEIFSNPRKNSSFRSQSEKNVNIAGHSGFDYSRSYRTSKTPVGSKEILSKENSLKPMNPKNTCSQNEDLSSSKSKGSPKVSKTSTNSYSGNFSNFNCNLKSDDFNVEKGKKAESPNHETKCHKVSQDKSVNIARNDYSRPYRTVKSPIDSKEKLSVENSSKLNNQTDTSLQNKVLNSSKSKDFPKNSKTLTNSYARNLPNFNRNFRSNNQEEEKAGHETKYDKVSQKTDINAGGEKFQAEYSSKSILNEVNDYIENGKIQTNVSATSRELNYQTSAKNQSVKPTNISSKNGLGSSVLSYNACKNRSNSNFKTHKQMALTSSVEKTDEAPSLMETSPSSFKAGRGFKKEPTKFVVTSHDQQHVSCVNSNSSEHCQLTQSKASAMTKACDNSEEINNVHYKDTFMKRNNTQNYPKASHHKNRKAFDQSYSNYESKPSNAFSSGRFKNEYSKELSTLNIPAKNAEKSDNRPRYDAYNRISEGSDQEHVNTYKSPNSKYSCKGDSKFNNSNFDDRPNNKYINNNCNKYNSLGVSSTNPSNFLSKRPVLKAKNFSRSVVSEENISKLAERKYCVEEGFFLKINVSENSKDIAHWQRMFKNLFGHEKFDIDHCCDFSEILNVNFHSKSEAIAAERFLGNFIRKSRKLKIPHIVKVSKIIFSIQKPCDCENKMISTFQNDIEKLSDIHVEKHCKKIESIEKELSSSNHEIKLTLKETIKNLEDMKTDFIDFVENLMSQLNTIEKMHDLKKLRVMFSRECNNIARCLPIYSRKKQILELLRYYSVSVVVAETGSGKSTQLVEYFLQTNFSERGKIICTQPRKIAAIATAEFVSGQLGSSVGKIVGYDIGLEKKYNDDTKVIYMTDYCLLKKILSNHKLKGISCVIVDEAHERTLHTDLLLSLLKVCVAERPDFRLVITSATIDPIVFKNYFNLKSEMIIHVPGRLFPVEVVWLEEDKTRDWNYLEACVKLSHRIYVEKDRGDILVFLTSPGEVEDAITMFKNLCRRPLPQVVGLHGKSNLNEQRLIFHTNPTERKVIFATNSAETSLTIPGIKYVIDSGMVKEKIYFPKKNKSLLVVSFINKSSAEQRKGRAGRTQPGICYRMYSKNNYERDMRDRALPELLKTNIQSAILKVLEFGVDPEKFDFIESPPKEAFSKSLESLELLGAISNNRITDLGRKIIQIPIEPRLAKLVLEGIKNKIGYETVVIVSLINESSKLFLRSDKKVADKMRLKFCCEEGDLYTYLEIYKQWKEVEREERNSWCQRNFISSRALNNAAKSVQEITRTLCLELSIRFSKKYNNSDFKLKFKDVIFDCFSENLCVFSGHPKVGYVSPYLPESFSIHPSSALSVLNAKNPNFLVYCNLMETSRNFLLDVTPVEEEVLTKAYNSGTFKLDIAMLKRFQILPKVLGPFGESVLVRYVLGKGGKRIVNLETLVENLTKTKNFKIDVLVDKGEIIIYVEKRFHNKITQYIEEMIKEGHEEMSKEEDIIQMPNSSSYFCLGAGGTINDVIMPGEFKEFFMEVKRTADESIFFKNLETFGSMVSFKVNNNGYKKKVSVTFSKVSDAQSAFLHFSKDRNVSFIRSNIFISKENEKSLPFYALNVSWCRRSFRGFGSVEFHSESDCILASGALTSSSFFIGDNYIHFSPSSSRSNELTVKNVPITADEKILESKLKETLPSHLNVKSVHLARARCEQFTENDIELNKKKLLKLFGAYSSSDKLIFDVKYPEKLDINWKAVVYFEDIEAGERAFRELEGKAEIDSFPVTIKQVLTSKLSCKSEVYKVVESEIKRLVEDKKESCNEFSVNFNSKRNAVLIKFGCKDIKGLNFMQQKILQLLQGHEMNFFGNSKYLFLFSKTGKLYLESIQAATRTFISTNGVRRIVSIFGPRKACREAELQIHSLATSPTNRKVFDIKRGNMPPGFLKVLYNKFGFDLCGLLSSFKLSVASVDVVAGTLTLQGDNANVKQAEEELEKICSQLHHSKDPNALSEESGECCSICLDIVSYDFQRLESCGHAFCKQCLLLQLESRNLPLRCIKENCDKLLFLEDIKKILSFGGMHLKKTFCVAALQYHVNCNMDKIAYCPTPDCLTIYRRSKSSKEFKCPICENTICVNCQTVYHHGMSCEMYQNSQIDQDFSLKCWMKENTMDRKYCPECNVPIEKTFGCNHVECANCKSHLCWLCCKVFPIGDDVYTHQAYCPMNQGNN